MFSSEFVSYFFTLSLLNFLFYILLFITVPIQPSFKCQYSLKFKGHWAGHVLSQIPFLRHFFFLYLNINYILKKKKQKQKQELWNDCLEDNLFQLIIEITYFFQIVHDVCKPSQPQKEKKKNSNNGKLVPSLKI